VHKSLEVNEYLVKAKVLCVLPPCKLLRSGRAEAVAPAARAAANLLHDDLAP